MLIVPTSLDTAMVFELRHPLILAIVAYASLAIAALCLWEMLASLLTGAKPRASRWLWLAAAVVFLLAAVLASNVMFGPVTFNADRADWVSTSWGTVLGEASLGVFAICAAVTLALRALDMASANRSGQRFRLGWRLLGFCTMIAYGTLLAMNEAMLGGPALENAVLVAGFALAVVGTGSLAALAVIRRMRIVRSIEAQATSV